MSTYDATRERETPAHKAHRDSGPPYKGELRASFSQVFSAGRYPGVVLTGNDVGRQRRRQWRPARAMVGAMVTTHEPIQVLDGREATSVVTVTRLAPLGIRGKCVGQSFRHGLRPPRRVFLFGVLQSWSLGIEPDLLPPSQFQERDLAGLRGQDSKIGRKPLLEL